MKKEIRLNTIIYLQTNTPVGGLTTAQKTKLWEVNLVIARTRYLIRSDIQSYLSVLKPFHEIIEESCKFIEDEDFTSTEAQDRKTDNF